MSGDRQDLTISRAPCGDPGVGGNDVCHVLEALKNLVAPHLEKLWPCI
jgi:hypothetical protein